MRLLVVTLCCFVAPPIVRADPTEDAVIKAIKQLTRRSNRMVKLLNCPRTRQTLNSSNWRHLRTSPPSISLGRG
jgi:hypothetical protein